MIEKNETMGVNGSSKAERRKRKSVTILLGLIAVLAILFVFIEWNSKAEKSPAKAENVARLTIAEQAKPQPQPAVAQSPSPPRHQEQHTETIAVVEDNAETVNQDITISENTQQEASAPVNVQPAVVASASANTEELPPQHVFDIVEQMPEYPGGYTALTSFLNRNIRYPIIALENGVQGRVMVSFTVNQDGSIVDVEVLRSINPSLDQEAKRLVSSMPKWMPGRQRGKPVRVKYAVPVHFRLQQ